MFRTTATDPLATTYASAACESARAAARPGATSGAVSGGRGGGGGGGLGGGGGELAEEGVVEAEEGGRDREPVQEGEVAAGDEHRLEEKLHRRRRRPQRRAQPERARRAEAAGEEQEERRDDLDDPQPHEGFEAMPALGRVVERARERRRHRLRLVEGIHR